MKIFISMGLLVTILFNTPIAQAAFKDDVRCAYKVKGVSALNSLEEARSIWANQGYVEVGQYSTPVPGMLLNTLKFSSQPDNSKFTPDDITLIWSESSQNRGGANRAKAVSIKMTGKLTDKSETWDKSKIAFRITNLLDNWCEKGAQGACTINKPRRANLNIKKKKHEASPSCSIQFVFHAGKWWHEQVKTDYLP
jgi:hypothetical protein